MISQAIKDYRSYWKKTHKESVAHSNKKSRAKRKLLARGESIDRVYNIRRRGITLNDYQQLFVAQGGVCAICKESPVADSRGYFLHIDHDHETGLIRGLLCGACNTGIGKLKDSPVLLQRAINYLTKSI